MRIFCYSDLHIREERLEDCVKVLRSIPDLIKDKNIDLVYNGGDTFNTRGLIRTSCFQSLYSEYKRWNNLGISQIINVGNHDQEDKEGSIHPMKIFEEFGWIVVDRPINRGNFIFMPYMKAEKIEKYLSKVKGKESKALFVHWGIQGSYRNDSNIDTEGIPTDWVDEFKIVISGHYHYRNKIKNVQYIGSPLQQTFAEMGQSKGGIIYDYSTNKVEFVEIKGTPKHYEVKIDLTEGTKDIPKEITEKDFVRVKIKGESQDVSQVTRDEISKYVSSSSIKIEKEIVDKSYSRLSLNTKEIHDNETLMRKYIDFINTDLDKNKLIKMGLELL